MALGTPVHRAISRAAGSSIVSASFTVPAGDAIYVFWGGIHGSVDPSAVTISDSQGLTWTQAINTTTGSINSRGMCWRAVSNGNAMTVTITGGANPAAECGLAIVSIDGSINHVGNVRFNSSSNGNTGNTMLSAPLSTSVILCFFFATGTAAATPPAGSTPLGSHGTDSRVQTHYDPAPPESATWSFTSANTTVLSIAIEVRAPHPSNFGAIIG